MYKETISLELVHPPPPDAMESAAALVKKRGRPSKESIEHLNKCIHEATDKVVELYEEKKKLLENNPKLPNNTLKDIVTSVRIKRNLPDSFNVKRDIVFKHMKQGNTQVILGNASKSPLYEAEKQFVCMLLFTVKADLPLPPLFWQFPP